MAGEQLRQTVAITNAHGFHMRPAQAFVATAQQFADCEITVTKAGEKPVNGRSMLGLIGMYCPEGTELVVEVKGPRAEEAMKALLEVFKLTFDES
jgi:phosphocarrier protein